MKNLILIILLSFSVLLSAQETTTSFEQTSDTTFLQTNITTYPGGRVVTETIPYTVDEFANLAVDQNIENIIHIQEREKLNSEKQRDVNGLKRYLTDSLSVNYDSLLAGKLLVALSGDWKLIERQNGNNNTTNVSITAHPTNPTLLRMKNNDGPGAWNLKNISTHNWEIRNFTVGGINEVVTMTITQFPNFTGYRGKDSAGNIIILKR